MEYYYRRETENGPRYQTCINQLDDPDLTEITKEQYDAAVDAMYANQPEPTDEATEADLMDALAELGVIG